MSLESVYVDSAQEVVNGILFVKCNTSNLHLYQSTTPLLPHPISLWPLLFREGVKDKQLYVVFLVFVVKTWFSGVK